MLVLWWRDESFTRRSHPFSSMPSSVTLLFARCWAAFVVAGAEAEDAQAAVLMDA
jgi:hypothetical protein